MEGDYCLGGVPQDVAWSRGSCSVFFTSDEVRIAHHGGRYGCLPLVLETNPKKVTGKKKLTRSSFVICGLVLFTVFWFVV